MSDKLREVTQNLVAVFDDLEQKTGRRSGYWIERSRIDALRKALADSADTASVGEATQRAMHQPEIPHNEAGVPIIAESATAEPLPCPFCGGEPYVIEPQYTEDEFQVGCDGDDNDCQVNLFVDGETFEKAVELWNHRAALAATVLRKQTLWECINWYTMSLNTEYEKQERKVLDQAIDAALADSANREMICEAHPWLYWPHGRCGGPGCPVAVKDVLFRDRISALQEAVKQRDTIIADFYHATADAPPEPIEAIKREVLRFVRNEVEIDALQLKALGEIIEGAALTARKEG